MRDIFIFSGLGADKSVLRKLSFPEGNKIHFVDWIPPEKNESLGSYAKKIAGTIKGNKPVLIGVSFGGILAGEIAKYLDAEKVIIISCVKNSAELPFYYRWAGKLMLYKLIPINFIKNTHRVTFWFFGVRTTTEQFFLKSIIKNTDEKLLKWSLRIILNFKREEFHQNLFHIHGRNDRLLPSRFIKSPVEIVEGGHFIIFTKAQVISKLIEDILTRDN